METQTSHLSRRRAVGFLSLAPDTRNSIYELVYRFHKRHGKVITICSEKGYREVPVDISRTCRQVRRETLPYFFDLSLITFVVEGPSDFSACKEWLGFVPESAWAQVQGVRFKQAHATSAGLRCDLCIELSLTSAEVPVKHWGGRQPDCERCETADRQMNCVPMIDLILKEMCAGGKITNVGIDLIFDLLQPLVMT
jgi:hypothetical protein